MDISPMCARLMSVGLTKMESTHVLRTIDQWVRGSGQEWTVDRLKEIKRLYISSLLGKKYVPEQWISLNKSGLTPRGPIKHLFKAKNRRSFSKVLTGLNAYSYFVSEFVTPKQSKKFLGSVEHPSEKGLDAYPKIIPFTPSNRKPPPPIKFVEVCNGYRSAPYGYKTCPERDWPSILHSAALSIPVRGLLYEFEDLFEYTVPLDAINLPSKKSYEKPNDRRVHNLGHLSPIQENGLKMRGIANPNRVIQAGLEPFKRAVMDFLHDIPEDYAHNQKSAIPVIQKWMKDGKTVHSVDLSDATNMFPWFFQLHTMKKLFPKFGRFTELMNDVVKGPWLSKIGEHEIVRFTRGQPLGLGPSFGVFSISHHVLVKGICEKHHLPLDYCILGDDIVIANDRLHHLYRLSLDNLGCVVSEKKCFSSKTYAEFAGFSILPEVIGKSFKWRDISDVSFIDAARLLGRCALGLMRPKQRDICKILSVIHRDLGGLGWPAAFPQYSEYSEVLNDAAVNFFLAKEERVYLMENLYTACNYALHGYIHGSVSIREGELFAFSNDTLSEGKPSYTETLKTWLPDFNPGPQLSVTLNPKMKGYFNSSKEQGDPRSSCLSLVQAMSTYLSHFPDLAKTMRSFVTVFGRKSKLYSKEKRRVSLKAVSNGPVSGRGSSLLSGLVLGRSRTDHPSPIIEKVVRRTLKP